MGVGAPPYRKSPDTPVTRPVRTKPEASDELNEATLWYDRQRVGLGSEFLDAVDVALAHIARWPQAGLRVPDVSAELPVRRVPLRRFPYHVVYLEMPEQIRILAIAHDHRLPEYWRSRAVK